MTLRMPASVHQRAKAIADRDRRSRSSGDEWRTVAVSVEGDVPAHSHAVPYQCVPLLIAPQARPAAR
jgi:hypothetical protein